MLEPTRERRLTQMKRTLERILETEMRRPRPDSLRLQMIKRLKLRVKDRLTRMRRDGGTHGPVSGSAPA